MNLHYHLNKQYRQEQEQRAHQQRLAQKLAKKS